MRAALAALLLAAALGACNGDDEAARPPIERLAVGSGERGATIVRERGTPPGAPVVVFLHGWSAVQPERYGPWLEHLARQGSTVIYPTYQRPPFFDVQTPLTNAVAGLRAALERLGGRPGPVVVAGHSAGGALA
ncbi:MAG: alpha/beta fold hydrolase, partial [Actinomycetota bacterium]|nr:alpha/beta fold hydrolase [Actinomycetota bacterium]